MGVEIIVAGKERAEGFKHAEDEVLRIMQESAGVPAFLVNGDEPVLATLMGFPHDFHHKHQKAVLGENFDKAGAERETRVIDGLWAVAYREIAKEVGKFDPELADALDAYSKDEYVKYFGPLNSEHLKVLSAEEIISGLPKKTTIPRGRFEEAYSYFEKSVLDEVKKAYLSSNSPEEKRDAVLKAISSAVRADVRQRKAWMGEASAMITDYAEMVEIVYSVSEGRDLKIKQLKRLLCSMGWGSDYEFYRQSLGALAYVRDKDPGVIENAMESIRQDVSSGNISQWQADAAGEAASLIENLFMQLSPAGIDQGVLSSWIAKATEGKYAAADVSSIEREANTLAEVPVIILSARMPDDRRVRMVARIGAPENIRRAALRLSTMKERGVSVPAVYGISSDENLFYQEYVKGKPLGNMILVDQELSSDPVVLKQIAVQIFEMHEAGFIHGDLQPANLFWDEESMTAIFIDPDSTLEDTGAVNLASRIGGKGELMILSDGDAGSIVTYYVEAYLEKHGLDGLLADFRKVQEKEKIGVLTTLFNLNPAASDGVFYRNADMFLSEIAPEKRAAAVELILRSLDGMSKDEQSQALGEKGDRIASALRQASETGSYESLYADMSALRMEKEPEQQQPAGVSESKGVNGRNKTLHLFETEKVRGKIGLLGMSYYSVYGAENLAFIDTWQDALGMDIAVVSSERSNGILGLDEVMRVVLDGQGKPLLYINGNAPLAAVVDGMVHEFVHRRQSETLDACTEEAAEKEAAAVDGVLASALKEYPPLYPYVHDKITAFNKAFGTDYAFDSFTYKNVRKTIEQKQAMISFLPSEISELHSIYSGALKDGYRPKEEDESATAAYKALFAATKKAVGKIRRVRQELELLDGQIGIMRAQRSMDRRLGNGGLNEEEMTVYTHLIKLAKDHDLMTKALLKRFPEYKKVKEAEAKLIAGVVQALFKADYVRDEKDFKNKGENGPGYWLPSRTESRVKTLNWLLERGIISERIFTPTNEKSGKTKTEKRYYISLEMQGMLSEAAEEILLTEDKRRNNIFERETRKRDMLSELAKDGELMLNVLNRRYPLLQDLTSKEAEICTSYAANILNVDLKDDVSYRNRGENGEGFYMGGSPARTKRIEFLKGLGIISEKYVNIKGRRQKRYYLPVQVQDDLAKTTKQVLKEELEGSIAQKLEDLGLPDKMRSMEDDLIETRIRYLLKKVSEGNLLFMNRLRTLERTRPQKFFELMDALGRSPEYKNHVESYYIRRNAPAIIDAVKDLDHANLPEEMRLASGKHKEMSLLAKEKFIPKIAEMLRVDPSLINKVKVRSGDGRCYHDTETGDLVVYVNSVLTKKMTDAAVKKMRDQGINVSNSDVKKIASLVETYVFLHELCHGVIRANSNSKRLSSGFPQVLTHADQISEGLAILMPSEVMEGLLGEGPFKAAFAAVCEGMEGMRSLFSLGAMDKDYRDQVETVREKRKTKGSFEKVYQDELAIGTVKEFFVQAEDLEPLADSALTGFVKAIEESLVRGEYPEGDVVRLIVTCAYGKGKVKERAEEFLVTMIKEDAVRKYRPRGWSAEVNETLEKIIKTVPGMSFFLLFLPFRWFKRIFTVLCKEKT
jgi:tRNA A-37 threonylcarbamoyl transferase component Bud32